MHTPARLALLIVTLLLVSALPAAGDSDNSTTVTRGFTHTEFFPDDICGPRASNVTFTETMAQEQLLERPDGSWAYRYVAQVTYEVDFVDPALTDYSGRLTEVNHYILTPGDTYVVTNTFHDFGGDLKIWERLNLKVVRGEVVVDRWLLEATGCP